MPPPLVHLRSRPVLAALGLFLVTVTGGGAAEGDRVFKFATGSFSQRPAIESSPAVDGEGVAYFGYGYDLLDPSGGVMAVAPNVLETADKTFRWNFRTSDVVEASPLLYENVVYFGAFDGVFYGVDQRTGDLRRRVDFAAEISATDLYIASTAAVSRDGATLYVSFGMYLKEIGGVIAFSRENFQIRWIALLPGPVDASPVIGPDGTLYVGCVDRHLYALAPGDGTTVWQRELDGPIWSEPALGPDGSIYVGSATNQFLALTPDNRVKWTRQLTCPGSPVVGAGGVVYVGNNADSHLYALNPNDGSTKWRATGQPVWGSTPLIRADGVILFGGEDGILRAYDAASGEIRWARGIDAQGKMGSSPAISPGPDKRILIGSSTGHLYAFEGNGFGVSPNASWPMFQHDPAHTGRLLTAPVRGGRLINLATRGVTGPNYNFIGGFVLGGEGAKSILMRAVGPTLQDYGVTTAQPDPKLTVYSQSTQLAANDNWEDSPDRSRILSLSASVGAFPLRSPGKDAVLINPAQSHRGYTGLVEGATNQTGVSLFEVWDTDYQKTDPVLLNLSTRGFAGTGENTLIPSLVVGGEGRLRVLLRAVGPSLAKYGVTDVLQRPVIQVYSGSTMIASGSNWWARPDRGDLAAIASLVAAQPLDEGSRDAAMILTLNPGSYTFLVSGEGGTTGNALVEVYALPF